MIHNNFKLKHPAFFKNYLKFHSFAAFSPIFYGEIINFISAGLKTILKKIAAKLIQFFFRKTDIYHTNKTIN